MVDLAELMEMYSEQIAHLNKTPKNNQEMVSVLEREATKLSIDIPEFFDSMRKVDKKHFVDPTKMVQPKADPDDFFIKCNGLFMVKIPFKQFAYELVLPVPVNGEAKHNCVSSVLCVEYAYLLNPQKNDRVVEISTGCGYFTSIMVQLVDYLASFQIFPEMDGLAKRNIKAAGLKLDNLELVTKEELLREASFLSARFRGFFDKLFAMVQIPEGEAEKLMKVLLKPNGVMLCPVKTDFSGGGSILRLYKDNSYQDITSVKFYNLPPLF